MIILLQLIVVLVIIGVVLWLINGYVPMPPPIKTAVNVLVVLALVLWLLNILGLLHTPPGALR